MLYVMQATSSDHSARIPNSTSVLNQQTHSAVWHATDNTGLAASVIPIASSADDADASPLPTWRRPLNEQERTNMYVEIGCENLCYLLLLCRFSA